MNILSSHMNPLAIPTRLLDLATQGVERALR